MVQLENLRGSRPLMLSLTSSEQEPLTCSAPRCALTAAGRKEEVSGVSLGTGPEGSAERHESV